MLCHSFNTTKYRVLYAKSINGYIFEVSQVKITNRRDYLVNILQEKEKAHHSATSDSCVSLSVSC